MPTTNCGADTPMKESTIRIWSMRLPRHTAARSPIVRPRVNSQTIAPTISRSVAGKREVISSDTWLLCR